MYCIETLEIDCLDGYHAEKIDEGIEQCVSSVTFEKGEYINLFDKCMNTDFCIDRLDVFDCNPPLKANL